MKVVSKTGFTTRNIRKTWNSPIESHVIKFVYYDRYEKRSKPSPWPLRCRRPRKLGG